MDELVSRGILDGVVVACLATEHSPILSVWELCELACQPNFRFQGMGLGAGAPGVDPKAWSQEGGKPIFPKIASGSPGSLRRPSRELVPMPQWPTPAVEPTMPDSHPLAKQLGRRREPAVVITGPWAPGLNGGSTCIGASTLGDGAERKDPAPVHTPVPEAPTDVQVQLQVPRLSLLRAELRAPSGCGLALRVHRCGKWGVPWRVRPGQPLAEVETSGEDSGAPILRKLRCECEIPAGEVITLVLGCSSARNSRGNSSCSGSANSSTQCCGGESSGAGNVADEGAAGGTAGEAVAPSFELSLWTSSPPARGPELLPWRRPRRPRVLAGAEGAAVGAEGSAAPKLDAARGGVSVFRAAGLFARLACQRQRSQTLSEGEEEGAEPTPAEGMPPPHRRPAVVLLPPEKLADGEEEEPEERRARSLAPSPCSGCAIGGGGCPLTGRSWAPEGPALREGLVAERFVERAAEVSTRICRDARMELNAEIAEILGGERTRHPFVVPGTVARRCPRDGPARASSGGRHHHGCPRNSAAASFGA